MKGPVPKRSSERIRRNKPETPLATIHALGVVKIPDLDLDNPHPIITELWDGMVKSAQSKYYEPSDWGYARLVLFFADQQIKAARPNGQILNTLHSMLGDLLVTEGSRRKCRIEVEREATKETVTDIAELFKQRLKRQ